MPRSRRPVVVRFPSGASHGLPLTLTRVEDGDRLLHPPEAHAHGFFSLMYVTSGRGVVHFGRESVQVREGSVVITPPGVSHDVRGLRGAGRWAMEFATDLFGAEGAGWMFPRPSQPEWVALLRRSTMAPLPIEVPPDDRGEWHRRFRDIHEELRDRPRGFREVVRASVKILLIRAARLAAPASLPESTSPLLDEVFDVIESRFGAGLSLADVARAVGRSGAYLTSLVRRETGVTVQRWIIERRMAEARQRLFASDELVVVVAERVGYADPALFVRHFKRVHGITPTAWRRGGRAPSRIEK